MKTLDFGENCVLGLSPMDDVTDMPFRGICKRLGADLLVTEFIASEALNREAEKSYRKMSFEETQRPLGIQIFGADEEELVRCLEIVEQRQPDFIDINWGCPVRKVAGKGAGSGILKDIPKMIRITEALVKRSTLPVTVKTRLGFDEQDKPIVEVAERLQDVGIAALLIHGRTKSQMYKGVADWSLIGKVKNNPRMHIPIWGNGDLVTPGDTVAALRRYGVDGVLIGRGAIGNPWIFEQTHRILEGKPLRKVTVHERAEICRQHFLADVAFKGEHTAIFEMRKQYGGYFKGIRDFKAYRIALVTENTSEGVLKTLDAIEQHPWEENETSPQTEVTE